MIRKIPLLLRTLGPRWAARRLWFAFERRAGLLRLRTPVGQWDDFRGLPADGPLLDVSGFASFVRSDTVADAEAAELHQGRLRPFSGTAVSVGNPPNWHRSALCQATWPHDVHWSDIPDAGDADIKGVWEASRWSWAYALGRAYLKERDPRHAELFWTWVEDWMAKNPPNLGVNWRCGQEASFRMFAAAWARAAFADAPSTTPARLQSLARLAHVTGLRIEGHLGYAISQDNNHGVSEAIGLFTIGALWPSLPRAKRWRAKGLRVLARLCDRLVAPDGSFSQHSSNYHRVFLDDLCWAEAVARAADMPLPDDVIRAARRAADFLHALRLPDGSVVRYGADDGARVLQLSACAYDDFRPTLAACAALFGSNSVEPGPWDAQAAALCPGRKPSPHKQAHSADMPFGGMHIRRQGDVTVAFRAPTCFRTRPSHADQLHVSVCGANGAVTEDVGTLSYNDPVRPWADLSSARFHNVPTVDDGDPMDRAGRFLWLPWTPCQLECAEKDRLVALHRGYRGFSVRREVSIRNDHIRVTDTFSGDHVANLAVRWHARSRVGLETIRVSCDVAGSRDAWHSAEAATGLGLHAERYAKASASHCRIFSVRASSAKFTTVIPLR